MDAEQVQIGTNMGSEKSLTSGQRKWREKSAPNRLTEEQRRQVLEKWKSGSTMTAIAKEFGVVVSTIHRVVKNDVQSSSSFAQASE